MRVYISGINNHRWNNISKFCKTCGQFFYVKRSAKEAKYCSNKCRYEDFKILFSGPTNVWYIDGRMKSKNRHPKEFRMIADDVRKAYSRTCVCCGKREKRLKTKLNVHHIDHNKHNNEFNNLIPVCDNCHGEIHGERFRVIRDLKKEGVYVA
jgi:hypothetical protein